MGRKQEKKMSRRYPKLVWNSGFGTEKVDMEKNFLVRNFVEHNKDSPFPIQKDTLLISRAYDFSKMAHQGQKRFSGKDYFTHPAEVANILLQLNKDADTIAAGLLHDVVEESDYGISEIERQFGADVGCMVNALTLSKKASRTDIDGLELKTDAIIKIDKCPIHKEKVLIIKLADRLSNMRDLSYLPEKRQVRYAIDSLIFLEYFNNFFAKEEYLPLCNEIRFIAFKKIFGNLACV